jgi:hypothetical protein
VFPQPVLVFGVIELDLGIDVIRIARRHRDIDPASLVTAAGADISRPAGGVEPGPAVGVRRDRCEIARTSARGKRSLVNAVRAVLIEIGLDRRGESAHTDGGDDAGGGPVVDQRETGDVLALGRKGIGRARTGPIRATVVGKIKTGFRAGHDIAAVVGIHPNLAHGLILRELARGQRQTWAEHICAHKGPGSARVSGLQNALAPHRERPVIQVAGTGVNRVVIVRVDRERVDVMVLRSGSSSSRSRSWKCCSNSSFSRRRRQPSPHRPQ